MEHQSQDWSRRGRAALSDTIVAAATPPGRGGVAIVRICGRDSERIGEGLLGKLPTPRMATAMGFRDAGGALLDHGLALYFPAPHSYTGDSVLELHGHGGPVVVEGLIRRAIELGARRAAPGEFTQRAYLNGKLDLAQAEAVADLIDAASQAAASAALRSLAGAFSERVTALSDTIGQVRVLVEAAIDFAEEQIDVLSDEALRARLEVAQQQLSALHAGSRQGRLLTEGMTVVISGRPNAGKSTLLNRLAGYEAAIVTDIPGTTRDILRERIVIDGMPLHLLDSAGLRESTDPIEMEGIRRARAAMSTADRVLFVLDAADPAAAADYVAQRSQLPGNVPITLVLNKIDLAPDASAPARASGESLIRVSARSGEGLEALREHLKDSMGFDAADSTISARARHVEALERVQQCVSQAATQLIDGGTPELIAEELRRAQLALGEIVGEQSSDELLGRIFAAFCIGK